MTQINLKKNIITSGSFRLLIMVVSFFTSVMSARYLGVEIKGRYSYLITMTGFAWATLDLGVYRSIPYLIRKFPEKVHEVFSFSLFMFIMENILLGFFGLLFIDFWSGFLSFELSRTAALFLIAIITTTKFAMQLQSLQVGMDKIWSYSIARVLSTAFIAFLLMIALLFFGNANKLLFMLAIMIGSQGVIIGYFLGTIKCKPIRFRFDPSLLKLIYTYSFRVFVSSLLVSLLIRFDIILIKKALGFEHVGIYSIAANIIDVMQIVSNSVGSLLLVKLTDSASLEEKWHIMRKLLIVFTIILGIANLGFVFLGRFFLGVFYGLDFLPVYGVYLWLIPASFSLSFGSLFNNYLNSKGFPIISIVFPAIALLINISLNLLLIPVRGICGAAFATSIAYTMWFVLIVIYEHFTTGKRLASYLVPRKSDFVEIRDYLVSLVPFRKLKS
ncbi:MAG: oligosaccharide flippase family protein [Candidatus Cloacimonetes bacterium]|jgi:O-antigen/teichoic acid export membrane protein|nr:oligosaccharide flippase family protein [Candidatus Cloacimonadota bacterium]MDD2506662.1 oligosaccharide flippase family protein [Candidatus Cloacimonadota bacterium]MDD4560278.1 oligosaccharide flippase family protein [Candidatus Cloacimonadota bacterium]